MSVGPYERDREKPMMPSATCLLKRPVSYVWQPKDARTLARPLSDEKKTSSSTIRPRIDEPSVYDTLYGRLPAALNVLLAELS